MSRDMSRASHS